MITIEPVIHHSKLNMQILSIAQFPDFLASNDTAIYFMYVIYLYTDVSVYTLSAFYVSVVQPLDFLLSNDTTIYFVSGIHSCTDVSVYTNNVLDFYSIF